MGLWSQDLNICVFGLWHLGTVTAACLTSLGHNVNALDFDPVLIGQLAHGSSPVSEPGLEELIHQGLESKRLNFTALAEDATRNIDLLWVTFDTPVDDDDNADTEFVVLQIERLFAHLRTGTMVLISSQLPVGSVARLEAFVNERFPEKAIQIACSPENLRLGRALEVFLHPDRIVVGVRTLRDKEILSELLLSITDRIEWMSVESAEMTKHSINAFLATSVVFANEIATICEAVGANAKEVERGLKTESRIGPKAYLSPGGAFAGGTLARDVAFLNGIATDSQIMTPLLSSVKTSNDTHKLWERRKLNSLFPDLRDICVAVWGLTYKVGTDTLRRSRSVELCTWLIDQRATIRVHDPAVRDLPEEWKGKVFRFGEELETLQGARVLVIATEWPQYKDIAMDSIAKQSPGLAILDANGFLRHLVGDSHIRYFSVGTPN